VRIHRQKNMRTLLSILCLSLLLGPCAPAPVSAQIDLHIFSGCVQDETGEPLIGASILIKGTSVGTVTDLDGCFSLEYSAEIITLVITYTGYAGHTVKVRPGKKVTLTLEPDVAALEEVVVTGYSVSYRRDAAPMTSSSLASRRVREEGASSAVAASYDARGDGGEAVSRPGSIGPAAGQLTAGEVNDFSKWEMWHDVSQEDLAEHRALWQLYPDHRHPVQLTHENGNPVVDVPVILRTRAGEVIWETRTDNHGRAELWRGLMHQNKYEQDRLEIVALIGGKEVRLPTAQSVKSGLNARTIEVPCQQQTTVDVALVVDATGSMGDEIAYLSSELEDVIRRSADSLSEADLRFGSVFYRDEGDDYLTRHANFTDEVESAVSFVRKQAAGGGGDTPEAVDAALQVALDSLNWSETAAARILFLVLDAPPHHTDQHVDRMRRLTRQAAKMGVRIIPVVCSGMNKSGEYLLRSMALATNGTYTFLTDHSGIGGKHLEPTTDLYEVELLNNLLVRLIHEFGQTQACVRAPVDPIAAVDEEIVGEFRAFPNPTSGPITCDLPGKKGHVDLIDLRGKIIQRYVVKGRQLGMNLGHLAVGMYVLRYESPKGKATSRRVMVNRNLVK
jgi:hypothetical protein